MVNRDPELLQCQQPSFVSSGMRRDDGHWQRSHCPRFFNTAMSRKKQINQRIFHQAAVLLFAWQSGLQGFAMVLFQAESQSPPVIMRHAFSDQRSCGNRFQQRLSERGGRIDLIAQERVRNENGFAWDRRQ